jgi:hypothetical protein
MSIANFFIVPSGLTATQFVAKSGNVYVPVNSIVTNVAPGDVDSLVNQGLRQVAGGLLKIDEVRRAGPGGPARTRGVRPTSHQDPT